MKNRTGHLQFPPKSQNVAQVAIVRDCQFSFQVIDLDGLTIANGHTAGGTIAHMSNSDLSQRKFLHLIACEHIVDQSDPFARGK